MELKKLQSDLVVSRWVKFANFNNYWEFIELLLIIFSLNNFKYQYTFDPFNRLNIFYVLTFYSQFKQNKIINSELILNVA